MRKKILFLLSVLAFLLIPVLPVQAESGYVVDEYNVLTSDEESYLNSLAESCSEKYKIGFYIRVMPDQGSYSTIEQYAENLYTSQGLGYGSDKNGIMLVLCMEDRSFDIAVYGEKAQKYFTTSVRQDIAERVVYDHLYYDNYSSGFDCFLEESASHVKSYFTTRWSFVLGLPVIGSIATLFGLGSRNKTTAKAVSANQYIERSGLNLVTSQDVFLFRNVVRTPIVRQSSGGHGGGNFHHSGGGGGHGGGFSHTSGHF